MELLLLGVVVGSFWWLFGKKKALTSSSGGEPAGNVQLSKEDAAFARQLAKYQLFARGRGEMPASERRNLRDYARGIGLGNVAARITKSEPAAPGEVDEAVVVLKKRAR